MNLNEIHVPLISDYAAEWAAHVEFEMRWNRYHAPEIDVEIAADTSKLEARAETLLEAFGFVEAPHLHVVQ